MTDEELANRIAHRLAAEFSIREPIEEIALVILEELNLASSAKAWDDVAHKLKFGD